MSIPPSSFDDLPPGAGTTLPGAALATLIVVPPPADLAACVEYVWQLVLPQDAPADAFWRVVADGYVDVAMRLPLTADVVRAAGATPASGAARRSLVDALAASQMVVCGAATSARALPMTLPRLVTGARFRLGAAGGVLRRAAADLVDGARPLDDVLGGRTADEAVDALAGGATAHAGTLHDAADAERAIRVLARESAVAVMRRLVHGGTHDGITYGMRAAGVDPRVRGALRLLDRASSGKYAGAADAGDPGAGRIAAIGRELAVSVRTLERLFADQVGFAPRTYQRLRRVGAVAEALEAQARRTDDDAGVGGRARRPTLSDLAHELGYTDHAHMTREFTRVMRVAPSAYRREVIAAPVARRFGAVEFERTIPLGTVGRESAA